MEIAEAVTEKERSLNVMCVKLDPSAKGCVSVTSSARYLVMVPATKKSLAPQVDHSVLRVKRSFIECVRLAMSVLSVSPAQPELTITSRTQSLPIWTV